jgi:predicted DNA repair protein MutK
VVHGLEVTHIWTWPYTTIHHIADLAATAIPTAAGFTAWAVTAFFDGIIGVILGAALIPVVTKGIVPLWGMARGK